MRRRWNLERANRKTIYWISLSAVILLIVLIGVISWAGQALETGGQTAETYVDPSERFAGIPTVEYKGVSYCPYERLTSILIIGVDRYSTDTHEGVTYRNGGQADYLLLLVINDDTGTITPIQIDRDTIAKITILGVLGDVTGTRYVQICLSHGFGDGMEQSCRLTAQAVSWFLQGLDVDFYISLEMDGITTLNDAVGGITVTLADDFSALDPAMVEGATLTLQGMQAEYYVRGRMSIGIGTNEARMVRQQVFMDALTRRITEKIHEDGGTGFLNNLLDTLDPYLLTDMKRGRIINLAWNTRDYVQLDAVRPAGEYEISEYGFNEFHVDEESLQELILATFYYPAETETEP